MPLLGYVVERLMRYGNGFDPTSVTNVELLPSRVTHLEMRRPTSFLYHAGEYLFVRCPAVSRYEWHPFTITSCPEEPDHLSLHVRSLGNWTNALYDLFASQEAAQADSPGAPEAMPKDTAQDRILVYLDGPYGALLTKQTLLAHKLADSLINLI